MITVVKALVQRRTSRRRAIIAAPSVIATKREAESACHQANGKGGGAVKSLDGSSLVLDADKNKEIMVLLKGQNNGAMPAWSGLSDTDIAAVISFTKNHWSNKTGQLVQPSDVLAMRK
jgi:cytochrome c oxidase subunit 2